MSDLYSNEALPDPFTHTSKIIHGEKVGRQVGFPTANFASPPRSEQLKPGVYFGQCQVLEIDNTNQIGHDCLVYFGPRYIFGERTNSFEAFIYDFDQDLYNKTISANLTHFLRKPVTITNLEQLKLYLTKDKKQGQILRTLRKGAQP